MTAPGALSGPAKRHVLHRLAPRAFADAGAGVGVGHRHAPGVDEGAREQMLARQADGGCAKRALHAVGGPQEARGAVGDTHVLLRRVEPLVVVAVQQFGAGAAAQHGSQLPGQVVGIGHAGVAAAGAKGADDLGRVAHEEHPADAQAGPGTGCGRRRSPPRRSRPRRPRRTAARGVRAPRPRGSRCRGRHRAPSGSRCARRRRPSGAARPRGSR